MKLTFRRTAALAKVSMADVDDWWTGYVVSIPGIVGSWVSFMYFGAGIWAVISVLFRRFPINIPKSARLFVIGCLGYAFTLLFSSVLNDGYAGILPGFAAGAAFYFVPFIISRYRFSNPQRVFSVLIAYAPLGAILSLVSALYQSFYLRSAVEGGAGNASVFGFIAAILGSISLANADSHVIEKRLWAIAGFLGGMAALFMSRTRSLYPIAAIAPAVFLYYSVLSAQYRWRFIFVFAFIAITNIIIFFKRFQAELNYTMGEISQLGGDAFSTSLGVRIELWKAAYSEFYSAPWFGFGQIHKMDRIVKILPDLISYVRFTHVHNAWMDTLLSGGFIGFCFINIIFLSSFGIINKYNIYKKYTKRIYTLVIITIITALNSMLNTIFTNDIMTTIYIVTIIIVYSGLQDN